MIKVQDLRIGNLVTDEWFDSFKQFILVCDINARGINLEITDDGNYSELAQHFITPEYEFEQLRGIPLTEEILLKVGFEHRSFYVIGAGSSFKWQIGKFILLKNFEGKFYVPTNESIVLESLHQLQNLYFALTGSELDTSKIY